MAQEQNIENQLKNMQADCNAVASYICPTGMALPWGVTTNCWNIAVGNLFCFKGWVDIHIIIIMSRCIMLGKKKSRHNQPGYVLWSHPSYLVIAALNVSYSLSLHWSHFWWEIHSTGRSCVFLVVYPDHEFQALPYLQPDHCTMYGFFWDLEPKGGSCAEIKASYINK